MTKEYQTMQLHTCADLMGHYDTARSITYELCADDLCRLHTKIRRKKWGKKRTLRALKKLINTYDRYAYECNTEATDWYAKDDALYLG